MLGFTIRRGPDPVAILQGEIVELIQVGQGAGIRLDSVNRTRITIGRSESCDVVISDATVSRNHAVLDRHGNQWRIRDAGSQNGIYLNGIRVRRSTPVNPGDGIQLGDTLVRLSGSRPEIRQDLITIHATPDPSNKALSPREKEVLTQVAGGRTDEEVAVALTVSVKTVRSHLDRIRDKTNARRRPDLTRHAMELGLIQPPTS